MKLQRKITTTSGNLDARVRADFREATTVVMQISGRCLSVLSDGYMASKEGKGSFCVLL